MKKRVSFGELKLHGYSESSGSAAILKRFGEEDEITVLNQ